MNFPEYNRAMDLAIDKFAASMQEAREVLERDLSKARNLFFEEQDSPMVEVDNRAREMKIDRSDYR